jgi:two-component system sensor histidine kinase KdpD
VVPQRTTAQGETVAAERVTELLLSVVSHDLRSPLTVILGAASSLETGIHRFDDKTRQQLLTAIREEAERLARRIDILIAVARAGASDAVERSLPVAAAQLIEAVRTTSGVQNVRERIVVEMAQGVPAVTTDLPLARLVLASLAERAIEQSPAGLPIVIGVSGAAGEVAIEFRPGRPAGEEESSSGSQSAAGSKPAGPNEPGLHMIAQALSALGARLTTGPLHRVSVYFPAARRP